MTTTSTGPLAGFSFSPSCSCKAVKSDGAADRSGELAVLPGWEPGPRSGANSRVKSKAAEPCPIHHRAIYRLVQERYQHVHRYFVTSLAQISGLTFIKKPPQYAGMGSPGFGCDSGRVQLHAASRVAIRALSLSPNPHPCLRKAFATDRSAPALS